MIARTLGEIATQESFLLWTTCIGLFLFLAVFIGSIVWISRRGSHSFYEKMGLLPLNDRSTQTEASHE